MNSSARVKDTGYRGQKDAGASGKAGEAKPFPASVLAANDNARPLADAIRRDYCAGKKIAELSEIYGVPKLEVTRLCKGLARRFFTGPPSPEVGERNARMREEFAGGESAETLSERYSLCIAYVRKICLGVQRAGGRRKLSEDEKDDIRSSIEFGMPTKDIVSRLNVSASVVERMRREMGKTSPEIAERNRKIRESRQKGESFEELSSEYGLAPLTIQQICMGVRPEDDAIQREKRAERNALIRKLYREGMSLRAIAEKVGLKFQTISTICKGITDREPVKMFVKPNLELEARNARIVELYQDGKTSQQIADIVGVSWRTVGDVCSGIKRRKLPNQDRNDEIRRRYAEGERAAALAKEFGLKRTNVQWIVQGVELNDGVVNNNTLRKAADNARKHADEIREAVATGRRTMEELAGDYGTSKGIISSICRGTGRREPMTEKARLREELRVKANAAWGKADEIRSVYAKGGITLSGLAGRYGTTPSTIYKIIHNGNVARIGDRPSARSSLDEPMLEGRMNAIAAKAGISRVGLLDAVTLLEVQAGIQALATELGLPTEEVLRMLKARG